MFILFICKIGYAYINMDYKWEYLFIWTYLQENNYQAEPQLSSEYYMFSDLVVESFLSFDSDQYQLLDSHLSLFVNI